MTDSTVALVCDHYFTPPADVGVSGGQCHHCGTSAWDVIERQQRELEELTESEDAYSDENAYLKRELAERDRRIERLEEDARRLEGVIALGLLDGLTATYMADKDLDEADFGTPEYKVACLAAIDAALSPAEGITPNDDARADYNDANRGDGHD
jgi:hypothetical protein